VFKINKELFAEISVSEKKEKKYFQPFCVADL